MASGAGKILNWRRMRLFFLGRHWDCSRVWCMSITILLCRHGLRPFCLISLSDPSSARQFALWLLTRSDDHAEYSATLSAGIEEGDWSGFALESRSKLPADQPTASGLEDRTFRVHTVPITKMKDRDNQHADTNAEAESPIQHPEHIYARACRWVQVTSSSPSISPYATLHKADQTISCDFSTIQTAHPENQSSTDQHQSQNVCNARRSSLNLRQTASLHHGP